MKDRTMSSKEKLLQMMPEGEKILWEGAPLRKPYHLERIAESLILPLVWMLVSFYILKMYLDFDIPLIPTSTLVLIMIVANIPMILWLCRTVTSDIALKNTYYIVTDKAIYFKNGANEFEVFKTDEERCEYKDIIKIWHHAGFVDKIYDVGDIYFKLIDDGKEKKFFIMDIKDPKGLIATIEAAKEGV